MNLLVDTHAFLWFCQNEPQLSGTARTLLEDPANRKLLNLVSCWEIAIKAGLKKLRLGEPVTTYVPNAVAAARFEYLPITFEHVVGVEPLRNHHKDPFDRLLIAQSIHESMPVVSADVAFDPYGVTRLW